MGLIYVIQYMYMLIRKADLFFKHHVSRNVYKIVFIIYYRKEAHAFEPRLIENGSVVLKNIFNYIFTQTIVFPFRNLHSIR